jgi:hypothetical protein
MWLDRGAVLGSDARWPPAEQEIAALAGPVIDGWSQRPRMVIDCRPSSARIGATSTYRLLSALRLERAAPVAVSSVHVESVYQALDSLLRVCGDGGPALAIGVARDTPTHWRVACCLLRTDPVTADSIGLGESLLSEIADRDGGFADLLTAALAPRSTRAESEILL